MNSIQANPILCASRTILVAFSVASVSVQGFTGQGYVSNSAQFAIPEKKSKAYTKVLSEYQKEPFKLAKIKGKEIPKEEHLQAYHSQLYKLQCLMSPDPVPN